ncbi:MAG: c-type cytochrome [Acidihalobacter sp.]
MAQHVSGRDPAATALMVVGSLLLLLVLVFLISRLVGFVASQRTPPRTVTSPAAVAAEAAGDNSAGEATALRGGKQIVQTVCISCHGSGVLGAPLIDSHAQWVARVGQGFDALLRHTVEGFKNMPPRGGDPSLSDGELKHAIAYMLDRADVEAPKGWEKTGPPPAAQAQ